jgi:hypothetical protein
LEGVALARSKSALVESGYAVPPGSLTVTTTLEGSVNALVFAGHPDLRIQRVITTAGVDVEFAGASPQDASQFFRYNPLPGPGGASIALANPTGRSLHLTVTSREVRPRH